MFDIIQDTYLKAFSHLDAFEGDAKFLPWVQQIAANTARDWLKRKRPMLFAEMASDDGQDTPMEELLPDERSENLPDRAIDQKETKRLIREILAELPEDQRAVIGMFFFEGMSVKQIAAAMGVSESAVKSRLVYARGKIEKKVRELEKKGTKLYNLAPLPFLLLLFRSLKAGAAEAPNAQILQAVLASQPVGTAAAAGVAGAGTAGTGTAGTTAGAGAGAAGAAAGAGSTAAAAGGLGALKFGIAALAAAAVIGLGVFGAVQLASPSDAPQEPPAREDVAGREERETPEELSLIDEAMEQYRIIIQQADRYEFQEGFAPAGYSYALVQMQPDDPVPTLLLEMNTETLLSYVRFFQYDPDTKTVRQITEMAAEGASSVEGYNGSLAMAGDGEGILDMEWSVETGETWISRITLDGDSLVGEVLWNGQFDQIPDSFTFIDIEWHKITDLA